MKRRKTFRRGGGPMRRTPAIDRAAAVSPVPARSPKPVRVDNSAYFMNLIDGVSSPIILKEFADFLGREGIDIISEVPTDRRTTRRPTVPSNFSGVAFDSAHWKGYENGVMKYDSYLSNIQRPATNNYCQSYATYLWAKQGNIQPFKKGEYAENVMKMSQIWYDFFNHARTSYSPVYWKDLKTAYEIEEGVKKYSIDQAIQLVNSLRTNKELAVEFANSKEDSVLI